MRLKFFAILAVVALALPAIADMPVTQYVSADDQSVAMLIRYIGPGNTATIAQTQGTSIVAVSTGYVADFICPSGGTAGTLDLTNGGCDTMGEIVDACNASTYFRCALVDALRSDSSAYLLTAGATQVTRSDGLPIYFDTSANFTVGEGRALLPGDCRTNIRCFVTPSGKLNENPYAGQQTFVRWVEGYSTYGSGTSALNVYSVKASNKTSGSETVTRLWNEAMGNTATNKQFSQFQYQPLQGRPNEKVIVRITNSAAQASVRLLVDGVQKPIQH